jgi:MYXO-CTERM domain-containing protein
MIMRRLLIAGTAILFLSARTAHAQEDETTPPTTVTVTVEDVEVAGEEEDSDNTGLWGLLGLLGLGGLAGLIRRRPTRHDATAVPSTGPVAPRTSQGATGIKEN